MPIPIVSAAGIVGLLIALTAVVLTADAAGGKNRLGDEDIIEGYVLCQQAGVEQVIIEDDGITAVINCEDVPGPDAQE